MTLDGATALLERITEKAEIERQTLLDSFPPEIRKQIAPVRKVGALTRFTANGNKYVVREKLALTRYEIFEETQIDVSYGITMSQLFSNIHKAYTEADAGRIVGCGTILNNILQGASLAIDKRENAVLKLCTLFICREGEDVTTYDAELAKDKIEDWRREGIAMDDFFELAFATVGGLQPTFAKNSPASSQAAPMQEAKTTAPNS